MWAAIVAIIPFLLAVFTEFFSAQAVAKKEDKVFELNQETFRAIVNTALNKHIASMAKASQGAGSAWDAADEKGKGNS